MKADLMKAHLLIPIFILSVHHLSPAQTDSLVLKKKAYHAWIVTVDNSRGKKGILFEAGDTSVLISNKYKQKDYDLGKFKYSNVSIRSIHAVEIRKVGNVSKGIFIGAACGLVAGIALTLIAHSIWLDPNAGNLGRYLLVEIGSAALVVIGIIIGGKVG